jgi:anti-sigma factor RsiW
MNDCTFQPLIGLYHDGELDAVRRETLREHLSACTHCSDELASLQKLSAHIRCVVEPPIDPAEAARLHQAVQLAADSEGRSLPLLRTAGLLTALAASVLIISGVWLMDMKLAGAPGSLAAGPARKLAPEWERVATTLHADPTPGLVDDSLFAPRFASTVNWILEDLVPAGQNSWEKPDSF